jgi:hypothetical protein
VPKRGGEPLLNGVVRCVLFTDDRRRHTQEVPVPQAIDLLEIAGASVAHT